MNVAVFGAGYAGLALARRLERRLPPEVELVVVDEDDHHLVQHEIHRAVRRPGVADDLRIPLEETFDRTDVRQARVTDVDSEAGVATFADGGTLAYDVGAVCLGAETAYYDLPGVEEHGYPLKRLEHAAAIREAFLDIAAAGGGSVVVGGAGLSGIQVAGELAALAREEGVEDSVDVRLLEQEATVAPAFPEQFQTAVAEELAAQGVTVRTGVPVERADADAVHLTDGSTVDADLLVWTGGIRGPAALGGERPVVQSGLRLSEGTFVVGDAARVVDEDGTAVPASAQAAVREAAVAADNVVRLVEYRLGDRDGFEPRLDRYRFDSLGWLVSVGDGAVAQVGSAVLTGPAAVALKSTVGAGYLTTVGSVRRAVELVREELGPPPSDTAAETAPEHEGAETEDTVPVEEDADGGHRGEP